MIALFFDTETTGLPSGGKQPALVQLAVILQDLESGVVLAELKLLANLYQGVTIDPEAGAIHGISQSMTARYGIDPKMIDVVFSKLLEKADVVVAHNIEFDQAIVDANLPLSASILDNKRLFCTKVRNLYAVKAPRREGPGHYEGQTAPRSDCPYKMPKLIEAYRFYFPETDGFEYQHDALADTKACRDVFMAMIRDGWYRIGPTYIEPTEKLLDAASDIKI